MSQTAADAHVPLSRELLKTIRKIEIVTSRRATEQLAGEYHSVFKGRGMSFDEVRPYQPGDEIRFIDWNVSARAGDVYVKRFVEERELTILLMVDLSASLRFGTQKEQKGRVAAMLTGLLAFSAIKNNDRVGLILFSDEVERFVPPKKGRKHVLRLLAEILNPSPRSTGTDLAAPLEYLSRIGRRKTIAFMISDFQAPPDSFVQPLRIAARRHDVVPIIVRDPMESELVDVGLAPFRDLETGEEIWLDTSSRRVREAYRERNEKHLSQLLQTFRRSKLDAIQVETGGSYEQALIQFFPAAVEAELMRRLLITTVVLALSAQAVWAADPPPAAAPEPATDAAPAAPADVTVTTSLQSADGTPLESGARLSLGAPATLAIRVDAPVDARLFVPSNPAIEAFRIQGTPSPPTREVTGSRAVEVHRFPIRPLRVGAKAIAPIEVVWRLPDGSSGSVWTERLRVRVIGRLLNEQDPRLASAPPPVPVITTNWALIWTLSILGAACLATLLTLLGLRLMRSRLAMAAPLPPPRPANEVALERLRYFESAVMPATDRYTGVVDVMRAYLGGRFGFDGLELTRSELLAAIGHETLGLTERQDVVATLDDADLVKFARFEPTDADALELIPRIRTLVEATWVAPEPEEPAEAEEPIRFEPATAAERVRAGLVDVALAAGAALVCFGGLWATGHIDLGWLAIILCGLILMHRDIAGPGSPGKALFGLRLVARTPSQPAPSLGARLGRNLLLLLWPIGLPVAALTLVYHPLHHRLGDLWAGTEVVRGGRP